MRRTVVKRGLAFCLAAMMSLGAAGYAFAGELVNIRVEKTTGGAILAYYQSGSDEVYLPIGETTAVPKGIQVNVQTSTGAISRKNGNPEREYLHVNGQNVSDESGRNTYTFQAVEDTTVTAGFKIVQGQNQGMGKEYILDIGYLADSSEDEIWYYKYQPAPGVMSQPLVLYSNGTRVDFTQAQVQLKEVYAYGAGGAERQYQPSQFTLTADGVLSSSVALDYGAYDFTFSAACGGVQEELYLGYRVGIEGLCDFPIYEVAGNSNTRCGITDIVTYQLSAAGTVGDLINAYNGSSHKKIAGYQVVGWKNSSNGAALDAGTPIASIMWEDGSLEICPVFLNQTTGQIYQVIIQ